MIMNTHYGISCSLTKEEQEQFTIIASLISDKMSIRNPNRHEFVKKLENLIRDEELTRITNK